MLDLIPVALEKVDIPEKDPGCDGLKYADIKPLSIEPCIFSLVYYATFFEFYSHQLLTVDPILMNSYFSSPLYDYESAHYILQWVLIAAY